jgi:hypothetical protein
MLLTRAIGFAQKPEHITFSYRFSHEATNRVCLDFRLNFMSIADEANPGLDFSANSTVR